MKSVYIISILSVLLLTSCASFSNSKLNHKIERLQESNLIKVNGTYSCVPFKYYHRNDTSQFIDSLSRIHMLHYLLNNQSIPMETKNALDLLESRNSYVSIKYIPELSTITIEDYENNRLISKNSILIKVKKGMLYLQNQNIKRIGIPIIYSVTHIKKLRIGVTPNGNLYVQNYNERSGGILGFAAGGSSDYAHVFKKLSD